MRRLATITLMVAWGGEGEGVRLTMEPSFAHPLTHLLLQAC